MRVIDAESARHAVTFELEVPFGIIVRNHTSCTPFDDHSCVVRYG